MMITHPCELISPEVVSSSILITPVSELFSHQTAYHLPLHSISSVISG